MRMLYFFLTVTLCLMTPCLADEKSGPGRTTLETFDGGTIYAVGSHVSGTQSAPGEWTLQTDAGEVVVRTTPWGFDIVGPKGTIKVSTSLNELTIEEGRKKYEVISEFGGKTVFSFPDKKIAFEEGGLNETTISGPKGKLKIEDSMNELKLTSPAGTTVFSGQFNNSKREGPALKKHPYTYRAFVMDRNGVGIVLDLMPYHHDALKPRLDWSRIKFF
jgi:hypothetical protein